MNNEAGARSYLRPRLHEGYVILLDSSREVVCEWHDRKYAQAIVNGEATIQEWGRLIRELALTRGYMIQTESGYVARPPRRTHDSDCSA